MIVKELIAELVKLNGDAEVLVPFADHGDADDHLPLNSVSEEDGGVVLLSHVNQGE